MLFVKVTVAFFRSRKVVAVAPIAVPLGIAALGGVCGYAVKPPMNKYAEFGVGEPLRNFSRIKRSPIILKHYLTPFL